MADYTLALLDIELGSSAVVAAAPTIPVPTLPGAATVWTLVATDIPGVEHATFTGVDGSDLTPLVVTSIIWRLEQSMEIGFDLPVGTPGLEWLPMPQPGIDPPEVKLYRNGHLLFRGPVTARRANSTERVWHYTAKDRLSYLEARNMGEAERHNYLGDSSFNVSAPGWAGFGSIFASIDNSRYLLGGGSLHMTASGSGENFLRKTFTIHAGPLGLALFLTAWYYVDAFTAPAYSRRAAFLGRVGATGPGAYGYSTIDDTTSLGTWLRMSTHVNMPPNSTETIEARLYCPEGEVHVDGVTVTIMESLSFVNENSPGGAGWDQVQIAQQTVRYLSGQLPVGNPYTKSNLDIHIAGDPSGIKKERTYQFTDARPGYEGGLGNGALDEWPRAEQGFDYRADNDGDNIVTFRTYFPAVGRTWTEPFAYVRETYDPDTGDVVTPGQYHCIVGWEWGETVEGSVSNIRELGNFGDGSGREEGTWSDPSVLGGLTREMVEAAPADAPLDTLDAIAKQRGTQLGRPIQTPIITFAEPRDPVTQEVTVPLIGELLPGDFLPITMLDGEVQMFSVPRASVVQWNPDETLSVSIIP